MRKIIVDNYHLKLLTEQDDTVYPNDNTLLLARGHEHAIVVTVQPADYSVYTDISVDDYEEMGKRFARFLHRTTPMWFWRGLAEESSKL